MQPPSISASAIKSFEECPAQFEAEYVQRVRMASRGGGAGDLGSAIHETLQWFVEGPALDDDGHPLLADADADKEKLIKHFASLAASYSLDKNQISQAQAMLNAWVDRWYESPPHQVLYCESKETFPLRVKVDGEVYEVPVTYIMDREDLMPDGSIKVVDYKSWMQALTGEEIHDLLQARIYALAAAIKYKDEKPPYIWVEFDQLRYGATRVRFSREDIAETWAYLKRIYERMIRSDGTLEIVGPACRWCVRAATCASLSRAMNVGTILTITDPETVAYRLAELNAAENAIKELKPQLQEVVYRWLEEQEILEFKFSNGAKAKITPKRDRHVDGYNAAKIIGPELAARYGSIGVTVVDELLKGDELDEDQKERLRKCVTEGMKTSVNATFPKK